MVDVSDEIDSSSSHSVGSFPIPRASPCVSVEAFSIDFLVEELKGLYILYDKRCGKLRQRCLGPALSLLRLSLELDGNFEL